MKKKWKYIFLIWCLVLGSPAVVQASSPEVDSEIVPEVDPDENPDENPATEPEAILEAPEESEEILEAAEADPELPDAAELETAVEAVTAAIPDIVVPTGVHVDTKIAVCLIVFALAGITHAVICL